MEPQPPPELIPDEHLTLDLAEKDPERFKGLLFRKLEEDHPLAFQAWNYTVRNNRASLEAVTLDTTSTGSEMTPDGNLTLGVKLDADVLKDHVHLANFDFNYEQAILYHFSHEVTHNFFDLLSRVDSQSTLRGLNAIAAKWRHENQHQGLTALGSTENYRKQGTMMQAREDMIELTNMYLLNPNYLRSHLDLLTDSESGQHRSKLGLTSLPKGEADGIYTIIDQAVTETLS